ncbi:MAG: family oxidoreductase [Thermomicrobiales bacterium]|jgi:NAD(P)-dependent dehydrogenase (short-subunit alcohol dehydrogenase family)|nr:family oxidoreductase [Thermomicrobiales bacterium]MDF3037424.1 family oxidoreductase [Thermomicrobiales bacterium]
MAEGRFSGKAALVTGAAQGIGRAIAERFASEGASVVLFDLDDDLAGRTAADVVAGGGIAEAIGGDIARRDDVRNAVARCLERFGRLDILAANAGIADAQPFMETEEASWRRIIDVNLTGTFFCLQEAARAMIPTGGGSMVATASTNAFWVESNMAAYNASKGGIVALVKSAAFDLGEFNIRVNAVAPGMVRTRANFITEDPVAGPEYLKGVPLGRFTEPAEMAAVVAFLASDDASYVTGELLVADGGTTIGVRLPIPETPFPGAVREPGTA